jgi:hypothetical protein
MVLRKSILTLAVLFSSSVYADMANNTWLFNPTAERMSTDDLNHYQVDCDHAADQRAFLQSQLQQISRYDANNIDRAIILSLLSNMEYCSTEKQVVAVGCLHVREDMRSGSSMATICNGDPNGLSTSERPVVNRWDPLVDKR